MQFDIKLINYLILSYLTNLDKDFFLKHVKAWLKPHLHKIRKTVITLPGFGLIFAEMATQPKFDLNILRPIKYDKMGHMTIINCFIFWKNN